MAALEARGVRATFLASTLEPAELRSGSWSARYGPLHAIAGLAAPCTAIVVARVPASGGTVAAA